MNIKSKPKGMRRNLGAKFAPERPQRVLFFQLLQRKGVFNTKKKKN